MFRKEGPVSPLDSTAYRDELELHLRLSTICDIAFVFPPGRKDTELEKRSSSLYYGMAQIFALALGGSFPVCRVRTLDLRTRSVLDLRVGFAPSEICRRLWKKSAVKCLLK